MVPVTSMFAAISGKPRHSEPVCRKRKARSTSTALRVLSVDRLGRMRTSLKSTLTSFRVRMSCTAIEKRAGVIQQSSYRGRKPQRAALRLGFDGRSTNGGRIGSVYQPDVAGPHGAMDAGGSRSTLQSRNPRIREHEVV